MEKMALFTIDGIYENGKVELTEIPAGVQRANVRATFLPDAPKKRAKPRRKTNAADIQAVEATTTEGRYPQSLRDEYQALIYKKLHRTMAAEDTVRLGAVRAEINQCDRQSDNWAALEQKADEVDREIAELRQKLQALPDA
jgi:hypothetical protein